MTFIKSIKAQFDAMPSASQPSTPGANIFERDTLTNQIYLFTETETWVQRVLAISSSATSIIFCLAAMYAFLAIDPRRLVFRHQLIAFLLSFDLLKAVILLMYPSVALTFDDTYYDRTFCQVVGFFTAVAIEGADLAILAFAIHTFLLIFKPNLSIKIGTNGFVEGGLYKYRFYVYGLSFLIPTVVASLAYVNNSGYDSLICWCYLPRSPTWYRFVLSWVPRYIIVIVIITVYCVIYFHIIREFKVVGGMFTTIHKQRLQKRSHSFQNEKPSFYSALRYFYRDMKDRMIPQFVLPESKKSTSTRTANVTNTTEDKDEANNDNMDKPFYGVNIEDVIDDPEIQAQNLENFRQRQKLVAKQMKSIFIYPFAYCFIWLFPFILNVTQFEYEETHHPIYWLNCVSAFMQPFNGFVDTLVFFYREQPWNYTILRNFERENALKMTEIAHYDSGHDAASLATSARFTKQSLSASLGVDIYHYSRWRKLLNWIGLPMFQLPTEKTIALFHSKYVNGQIKNQKENADNSIEKLPIDATSSQFCHDFSNILTTDYPETEFRSVLDSYTLNISHSNGNNKSADNSNISINNTMMDKRTHNNESSIRSPRSSDASFVDLTETSNKSRTSSLSDLSQKNNMHQHLSSNPHFNKLVSYQQPKTRIGSSMPRHTHALSKRPLCKRNSNGASNNLRKTSNMDDMDFLEFIKKGP